VDGPQFHVENDQRLTRVGKFLRKTNLDEVPQFWNVLWGHMSLVGPRPSPDDENQLCPAWREARLSVRPGLTGMWQLRRTDRATGDFHQWIQYDTQYVREVSLRTDLKLLWETMLGMLKRL
jgi:lipopolysaccharide/colanic/teichoic acid biosynthesis glycosyltransferase